MATPKAVAAGLGIALVVATVWGSYYTIDPQEVGIVTRWGAIVESQQTQGLHFKVPFIDTVHYRPINIQELKIDPKNPVNTYTVDNQEVDVTFNVFYRIPPDKAAYVFQNIPDYQQRLMVMAIDRAKTKMGGINIQQLAEKRGEIRDHIKTTLATDAKTLGLEVTDFQLVELVYDRKFRDAVAAAAVQKANIESMEYQRQQAEKEAEKARIAALGTANANREAAKGEADARLSKATAEAKAIELEGLARATAITAQNKALQNAPDLVEYTKAQKWNGALPATMLSSTIPFMQVGPGGVHSGAAPAPVPAR